MPHSFSPSPQSAVVLYVDGASKAHQHQQKGALVPGGYGAVLLQPAKARRKEIFGGHPETTNNQMELMAAIMALEALKRPCVVEVVTDSQYVQRGMSEWRFGWARSGWVSSTGFPVKNRDLWQRLIAAARPHKVTWTWVRGHAGNIENERADELARLGMEQLLAGELEACELTFPG